VYDVDYHLVWCPRYGKPILEEAEVKFLEDQMATIAETRECEVLALEVRARSRVSRPRSE